jgi:FkbM family methyltransferase
MSILGGMRSYYSLFGIPGVLLVSKSRLSHATIEVKFLAPGYEHPLFIRLRTSDASLLGEILLRLEYDFELSKSPGIIVDAGANIGFASIFYSGKYPASRIIAIEPESSNFTLLKKNTANYSNITPVHAALWSENEVVKVIDPGVGQWGFQTYARGAVSSARHCAEVPGMTVDKLMSDLNLDHIDLLKVDIEGAEKEVFENSSSWIDKIGMIAIECHDRFKAGCSNAVRAATTAFEYEWSRGETTFLLRKQIDAGESPKGDTFESRERNSRLLMAKLPLKIISARPMLA